MSPEAMSEFEQSLALERDIKRRIAEAVEAAKQREQAEYSKVILIMAEKVEAARREEREAWEPLRIAAERMVYQHHDTCSHALDYTYPCDCGRDAIAAALRARSMTEGKQAKPVGPKTLEKKP